MGFSLWLLSLGMVVFLIIFICLVCICVFVYMCAHTLCMCRPEDRLGVGGLSLSVLWVQESDVGCKAQWEASLITGPCLLVLDCLTVLPRRLCAPELTQLILLPLPPE